MRHFLQAKLHINPLQPINESPYSKNRGDSTLTAAQASVLRTNLRKDTDSTPKSTLTRSSKSMSRKQIQMPLFEENRRQRHKTMASLSNLLKTRQDAKHYKGLSCLNLKNQQDQS